MLPYFAINSSPAPSPPQPRPRSHLYDPLKFLWVLIWKIAQLFHWLLSSQFSLRSCFVGMTLLAMAAAWIAQERRESSRHLVLAKKLEESGFRVTLAKKFCTPQTADCGTTGDYWWQEWLGELCGERIVDFSLRRNVLTDPFSDAVGRPEEELPWLADVYQLEKTPWLTADAIEPVAEFPLPELVPESFMESPMR